jgi:hypothetical protein
MLAPFLKNPYCLGLGKIGLEMWHSREKAILPNNWHLQES